MDIYTIVVQDFEAFKDLMNIDGDKAISEYLEYNALYDIDINTIIDILENYKHKNL